MGVPFTVTDYLAAQLRELYPQGDWNAAGIDRAHELADMLYKRKGVKDLSQLVLYRVTVTSKAYSWSTPTDYPELAFSYAGGPTWGNIGVNDRVDNYPYLQGDDIVKGGNLLAWSSAGHGNVSYLVIPSPSGGYAIAPVWGSSSDIGDFMRGVRFLATSLIFTALPAAGFSIGNGIGSTILGPTLSAEYPALATAIGNTALSTAFNGGNIAAAIKQTATAYAGSVAGLGVTDATGFEILGKVGASATTALLRGGDPASAAAMTLIANGKQTMSLFDTFTSSASDPSALTLDPITGAVTGGDTGFSLTGSAFDPNLSPSAIPTNAYGDFSQSFSVPTTNPEPAVPVTPAPDTFSLQSVVQSVSFAAMSALNLVAAYKKTMSPINAQARMVQSNGAVVAATDAGVVQTRDPNGNVHSVRPPVGVPQSTISGNIIVNNGDGTFTLIAPDGTQRVIAYGSDSTSGGILSSISPGLLLTAGLGIAGLALQARRRH